MIVVPLNVISHDVWNAVFELTFPFVLGRKQQGGQSCVLEKCKALLKGTEVYNCLRGFEKFYKIEFLDECLA